jgi:zinc and cadmium transporter
MKGDTTSAIWAYSLASVVLVSLLSVIGIVFISISETKLKQIVFVLVSLAVGSLFGDVFIHLLPQAFENSEARLETSLYLLAGIFIFFVLEKFIRWRHQHDLESKNAIHPVGYMNLLADGIHNFIDGMIIGASYMTNVRVGIATTIAVAMHELPQEISDFGVLLHAGFSKKKALIFNFLSAMLAILGTVLILLAGTTMHYFIASMLPLAAGGFVYIAGSDLVPELNKELAPAKSLVQLLAIATGVGLMLLLALLE